VCGATLPAVGGADVHFETYFTAGYRRGCRGRGGRRGDRSERDGSGRAVPGGNGRSGVWSSDEARSQFVNAWNLVAPVEGRGGAAGARGAGGRGARGGAAGEAPESGAAPAGGRGARGGRGGPPAGAIATPAAPRTPAGALAAALQAADGVGYLWSSESVGYALRYAHRMTQADGSLRIVLVTDRRLGSFDGSWKPATGVPEEYAFTVIELRLDPAMKGEGKTSLTGRVSIDGTANTIALEDYASLPVTLKNVRP
jgi:hypothetical protein